MITGSKKGAGVTWVRSSAGLVILFAMFAGIVLYMFLIPPDVREQILPPVELDFDDTVFDVSPGVLSYVDELWKDKSIRLNDVEINNELVEEKHVVSKNFDVTSTAFNQHDTEFRFLIDKSGVESAGLEFIVYEKTGEGNLDIYLNSKKIYANKAQLGDNIRVDLPLSDLREGENHVIISTTSPGALFWSKNEYTILNMNLVTEEYNAKRSTSDQVFSLTDSEAVNARNVKLYAYIVKNSEESSNIELILNNHRIYKATPTTNFVLDISADILKDGANILKWNVDQDAGYSIKQSIITMETVRLQGKQTNYIFNIGTNTYNSYINSDNYNCNLAIERSSGGDSFVLATNTNTRDITFIADKISLDICDDLKKGKNVIRFYTEDDDISLSKATLTIQNKNTD